MDSPPCTPPITTPPHTPISPSTPRTPITTPRTPISPSTPRTPITTPRTPPLSSSSLAAVVTPSPPGAPMKQRKIYSTPMLHLMDRIIQEGELLLVEYRRNQNTAEARENDRKRKIRLLVSKSFFASEDKTATSDAPSPVLNGIHRLHMFLLQYHIPIPCLSNQCSQWLHKDFISEASDQQMVQLLNLT
ncbi:unnamed protein product [Trifolium pratense]|uniref:Uncharacterized protein n=1 Tax=Trifolium pratense TaxID=57577 RepID=A0ACB0JT83_TRIPR|nr:unnamed protein product [Trifolium pratense]